MQVTVELPDDLAAQVGESSATIGRRMLETFAIDHYRSGALTGLQIQRLLDLKDRFELDEFLKAAGVFRDYSAEELEADYQASRRASDRFAVGR